MSLAHSAEEANPQHICLCVFGVGTTVNCLQSVKIEFGMVSLKKCVCNYKNMCSLRGRAVCILPSTVISALSFLSAAPLNTNRDSRNLDQSSQPNRLFFLGRKWFYCGSFFLASAEKLTKLGGKSRLNVIHSKRQALCSKAVLPILVLPSEGQLWEEGQHCQDRRNELLW